MVRLATICPMIMPTVIRMQRIQACPPSVGAGEYCDPDFDPREYRPGLTDVSRLPVVREGRADQWLVFLFRSSVYSYSFGLIVSNGTREDGARGSAIR